ncbi:MAG: PKD domain-containing protein, partial [Flavobacteriales bacterium]|nr:PKD domain-containing protein [Flavobacteriales bacterium]
WHYYSETNRQFHCFDEQNPTWSYTNETGSMDVTLMVGFNGCYSTTTVTDMIQVDGPIAEIFFNCECDLPFDVEFEDRSHDATDILWDFGDGNTSTDADLTHTYATTGDFTVILTATNAGTGCPTSYDTATVRIRDIQAEFQSDTLLCQDIPSSFNAGLSQDVFSDCWGGYTWQFDDPQMRPITTPDANFPIPFSSTGDFEVTLIVKDINGCKDTISNNVAVHSISADFSASETNFCAPQEVDFTDLTTSDTTVTSWFWILNGIFNTSTDQNPTYTYNNFNSSFDVIMGVENAVGCVDADTLTITMYEPQISLSSTPFIANICAGDDVSFTASPLGGLTLSYDWGFVEGGATSTDQNPTHTFTTAGSYTVTVDYVETSSGCFGSATKEVNVQDYPVAAFSSDGDDQAVFCNPQNVIFTDETTGLHSTQWNLGNGTVGQQNPIATVYTSGTYEVELIVNTNFGCSDTITRQYEVIGPMGQFEVDVNTICRGEEITFTITDSSEVTDYTWDFGDGTSAMNESPIAHTYTFVPPSGETVGKLIVTGPSGECPSEFTLPIFIHEVVAGFVRNGGDTAICYAPFPLENTSLNSDVFFWDFGDGTTSTSSDPGDYEFPGPGTYEVTLGVLNTALGCNDTLMKTVVLHPYPELDAIGDTICEGDVGELSVLNEEPTATYAWSSLELMVDSTVAATTSEPMFTAEYELTITDTNSCVTIDTTFIGVINPLVLSDWDTIIVIGDSICMPINAEEGLYIFEWDPTDGLDCDTCASPCLQPLELVTYEVQVTDVLNCFTAAAKYTIDIYPETFISFPTTFTPNGDDANDLIFVEGWGIKDLIEYKIFNRWGEELFFTQNVDEGWDGRFKGVLQNNDVYVYKIRALTWRDETKTLEGYFNLMR